MLYTEDAIKQVLSKEEYFKYEEERLGKEKLAETLGFYRNLLANKGQNLDDEQLRKWMYSNLYLNGMIQYLEILRRANDDTNYPLDASAKYTIGFLLVRGPVYYDTKQPDGSPSKHLFVAAFDQDIEEGIGYLQESSDLGCSAASSVLAGIYTKGIKGHVEPDEKLAKKYNGRFKQQFEKEQSEIRKNNRNRGEM